MGVLNNLVPFALIFRGETVLSSGLASILTATTPVFSLLVAHWLTEDEKLSTNKVAGIALGFAGVVVLVGAESLDGSTNGLLPILACMGAALSYGFANVFRAPLPAHGGSSRPSAPSARSRLRRS